MICNNCGSTNCIELKKQPGKIRCNKCLRVWSEEIEETEIAVEDSYPEFKNDCKTYFELTYKLFVNSITESEKNQRSELQTKLFKYFGVYE